MKVFSASQSRELEERAVASGISYSELMENAGAAAVRFLMKKYSIKGKKIVILCGKGNNGGDGFVMARRLAQQEARVAVVLMEGPPKTETAAEMYEKLADVFLRIVRYEREEATVSALLYSADLIVDAIYGTGFHGRVENSFDALFRMAQESRAPVISIDIPSGAECDTGAIHGPCMRAEYTVTFSTLKPVHLLPPAKEYCGNVTVSPIGISSELIETQENCIYVPDAEYIRSVFQPRNPHSNKGDYGRLLCICGSYGMAGAALLSIRAALRCGAGLVYAALPESIYPIVASQAPEAVYIPLKEESSLTEKDAGRLREKLSQASAVLIGCGLGVSPFAEDLLRLCFTEAEAPLLVDADGINLLSRNIHVLQETKAPVVLTPHPGEMARLTGKAIPEIQGSRLKTARDFAVSHGVTLVLKGSGTIIANSDGPLFLNTTGNPGMAKGGSGDVLAGMAASFAAQGIPTEKAAAAAVFLHGLAGDLCAKALTQSAMLPSDLIEYLPKAFLAVNMP